MVLLINNIFNNINRIFNYIIKEKFDNKINYYNCMVELCHLLKNVLNDIYNIYYKYILLNKLNKL